MIEILQIFFSVKKQFCEFGKGVNSMADDTELKNKSFTICRVFGAVISHYFS